MTLVDAPMGSIGLFRRGRTVYALRNRCPHNGAPVCLGPVTGTNVNRGPSQRGFAIDHVRDGEILKCPWHKWEFELATGASLTKPLRRVKTYPVVIEDERVYLQLKSHRKRADAETTDD